MEGKETTIREKEKDQVIWPWQHERWEEIKKILENPISSLEDWQVIRSFIFFY